MASFLRWFTLLPQEEVESIEKQHHDAPHQRHGQRALAEHMTELVHGESELDRAKAASQALFSGNVAALESELLKEVFADVPSSTHDKAALEGDGVSLVDLLPETSLASSKREAREFLSNNAVSVNGEKVGPDRALNTTDLLHGGTILIRRGKEKWHTTRWA